MGRQHFLWEGVVHWHMNAIVCDSDVNLWTRPCPRQGSSVECSGDVRPCKPGRLVSCSVYNRSDDRSTNDLTFVLCMHELGTVDAIRRRLVLQATKRQPVHTLKLPHIAWGLASLP